MTIIITEFIWSGAVDLLRAEHAVHAADDLWRRGDELRGLLAGAAALIVRNQTRVDAALLDAGPRLKVVGRLGVGLDNIDLAAAKARGVQVVFGRSANAIAVAEYVFAALFAVARRIAEASASTRAGGWDRKGFTGGELYGKTLGIVGLGDIGSRLALRARAFGMRVVASDPVITPSAFVPAELGVALLELDALLAEADYVSLHLPLTPASAGLFHAERLARMKPGAWLINTARGGVIDEAALADALRSGRPAGAILDVRAQEPPPNDDPLAALPNAILTPHIAGLTDESQTLTARIVAEDVLRVLRGERAQNLA